MLIPKTVLPISQAAPKKDCPLAHRGIHLRRNSAGQALAEVCHGHYALQATFEEMEAYDMPQELAMAAGTPAMTASTLVPRDAWDGLKAMVPSRPDEFAWGDKIAMREWPNADGQIEFEALGFGSEHSARVKPAEGEFPDLSAALGRRYDPIPASSGDKARLAAQVQVNATYLLALVRAMVAGGVDRLTIQVPLDPVAIVRLEGKADEGEVEWVAGVMPFAPPAKKKKKAPGEGATDGPPPDVPDMFEDPQVAQAVSR